MSGEFRANRKSSQFPWLCNNLRQKLAALLRPKIKTRKFALEVSRFSMKEESAAKVHMVVFCDSRGPIYQRVVPKKVKIGVVYYCGLLLQLQQHIRMKRLRLKHRWILHHDNATTHLQNRGSLAAQKIDVMRHYPYSPDLALCDFWLFSALKKLLRHCQFSSDNRIGTRQSSVALA